MPILNAGSVEIEKRSESGRLAAIIAAQAAIQRADHDLLDVMQMITLHAEELTDADGAMVEIAEDDEMVYKAARGIAGPFLGLRLKKEGSLSGYCVETETMQYARDTETDSRVDRNACRRIGLRSFIVVPLISEGLCVGVLKVCSRQPEAFDPQDIYCLQLIGGFLGHALARARAYEAQQLLIDELKRTTTALQEFTAIASHDLKEPLRKIQTFSNLLSRKSASAMPPEAQEYIHRIHNAAGRMQQLIDGLLVYSRTSMRPPVKKPVDLNVIASDVVSDLEARIMAEGGRVELGNLPAVAGDPLQLRQLLQNLIGNGLKFHREDAAPCVQVTGGKMEESVWLRVADNGIGIDPRFSEKIFQPFERLETTRHEGTGIGLAICRKIVERHGGTIHVEGRPGEGTTFVIHLPAD